MKFGVGQGIKRVEDQVLVTGHGRYTDDINIDGQAYASFVRSPHAHATITEVDAEEARKAPGVLLVLTAEDLEKDGVGDIPCLVPLKNRDGSDRYDTPRPVLARDKVRHVGEPVAMVVAETLAQARDAAELVMVEYDDLPVSVDTYEATQEGAPQVWDHIPNNIVFDWEMGDAKATDAAFEKAEHVTKLRIVNNRIVVNPMEPRAALAGYDGNGDHVTLYTATQGPVRVRDQIANAILHIEPDELRVKTWNVGGGFGMKLFVHHEQPLVVHAARKLKRAVKWTSDRSEGFQSDVQGRDHVAFAEMAMDKEGRFLGLRVTNYAAMGAYLSNMAPFIGTAGNAMLVGLYKTPAIYVNVKGVVTNTIPTDAYRGAGRPEAIYLVERMVDACARDMGLTPDEIRRRNFIRPEDMPYATPLGVDVYDSGEFQAVMEQAMKNADWDGFDKRRKESEKRGKLRGIGMATYVERCGGGVPETARARFNDDDTLTIYMGTQDNGQGHITSYKQIMSEALDIDADKINVVQGDTDFVPAGFTGGSRSIPVGGAAVKGAGETIRDKGKEIAAHAMEVAAADVEYGDGVYTVAGTDRRMSLFEVAKAAKEGNVPAGFEGDLDTDYEQTPEALTYPNGCHIVELEIDPETGEVDILRYTVVDDFGKVINPILLKGQVHGGTVQGIGQALHEYTVYDEESGQLVSGSFMDYDLPKADTVPMIDFDMHNVPCKTNPLGIKGAGEAGAIGAPPAIINALVKALHDAYGIAHIDMPATPTRIWETIQEASKKAA